MRLFTQNREHLKIAGVLEWLKLCFSRKNHYFKTFTISDHLLHSLMVSKRSKEMFSFNKSFKDFKKIRYYLRMKVISMTLFKFFFTEVWYTLPELQQRSSNWFQWQEQHHLVWHLNRSCFKAIIITKYNHYTQNNALNYRLSW